MLQNNQQILKKLCEKIIVVNLTLGSQQRFGQKYKGNRLKMRSKRPLTQTHSHEYMKEQGNKP
jgi:hypothetical protein